MLEKAQLLNQYEIVRLLGKGGMGEVYLARDTRLGRRVALKVLPEDVAGESERLERFEREARAVAALQHPNIVTLHGIEEAEGLTFLVMELIDGKPLSKTIPQRGLQLERFLEIAIALAGAVAAAHARGITHRDLKPDNVLIDADGRPQILDFGLAKVAQPSGVEGASMEPTEALTGEGRIVGTVAYMSPEQVEGREVDARSDIFSLGVMLYEMATGARPFEGDTSISVMTSILRDEPVSVTERNEQLPRYLGRIVKRCLQKDPSRRFQSAVDLRNDLVELQEELASGELTATRSLEVAGRRGPLWPAVAIGLALLALAGAWWLARRETGSAPAAGAAHDVRRLNVSGSPVAVAISPDGRYVAYRTRGGGQSELRLQQLASGSDIVLVSGTDEVDVFRSLAFTPDGEYVRYLHHDQRDLGVLWEVPVLGGPPRRLTDGIRVGLAYSPDGGRVAFVEASDLTERWERLVVVSLADGERRTVLELTDGVSEIEGVAWSPEGDRLALSTSSSSGLSLRLLSLADGSVRAVPGDSLFAIGSLCWSNPEELLVVGNTSPRAGRRQFYAVDLASGAQRRLLSDFSGYDDCSTSADGRTLATVREAWQSEIWVVPLAEPDAARRVPTTTGRESGGTQISWLGDDTILYGAPDGDTWNVWRVDAAGGTSVRVTTAGAEWPTASATGHIAFESGWEVGGREGIYVLDPGSRSARRVSPEGLFAQRPALAPGGDWVYHELLTTEGMQLVRSPVAGGEPETVTTELAHQASFSPDGSRVALHLLDPEVGRWQTLIFPVGSTTPERRLDLHSEAQSSWASDDSLFYSRTVDGVEQVYRVSLDDLSEEQVTFFAEGNLFSFDVSPDRSRLAVVRGDQVNDLLLIDGLLEPGGSG